MAAEKLYENKIKKFLKENGAWYVKYWAGAEFTTAGVPDILACVNGYFVGIEVKAANGKPSELQLYNLRELNNSGGYAFLLYPKDFSQFKSFVQDLNMNARYCDVINRYDFLTNWKKLMR